MPLVKMDVNSSEYPSPQDNPYGYGLEISLSEEQVEALGLDKNPPPAGSTVTIQAIARVTRVSMESDPAEEAAEGEDGSDVDVRLCLQITELDVVPQQSASARSVESILYGGS
jgi:hypothetical protein